MGNIVDMNGNEVAAEQEVDEAEIEKLMGGKLKADADLMLDVWRCYYLIRANMIYNSDGAITPETFQEISTALGTIAADGFDIGKLKKRIKTNMVNFIGRMANGQFNAIAEEKQTKKEIKDGGVQ